MELHPDSWRPLFFALASIAFNSSRAGEEKEREREGGSGLGRGGRLERRENKVDTVFRFMPLYGDEHGALQTSCTI